MSKLGMALLVVAVLMVTGFGCGDDDDDDSTSVIDDDDSIDDDDTSDDDDDDDTSDDDDDELGDIAAPPDSMPFTITRENSGQAPTTQEIDDFTTTMKDFFEGSDYFAWANRHSFGLQEGNPWGERPYKIWWTNAYAVKSGDTVTFTFENPPDNTTAKITRVLNGALSLYLLNGDEEARELALGYMRGLLATYDGMVWGNEDPPVDYLMSRTIFHRNQSYTLPGNRNVEVDYDSVRYEIIERRHDTIHNPENPFWGDIWVRNKRSKDDFPYLYRNIPLLARLIRTTEDQEMKQAALAIYRRIVRMAQEIVEQGYHIRTKGVDGEIFLPRTEYGFVDDFASFVNYEIIFPKAECNAKIGTAYIASGTALENDCGNGSGGLYEPINILGHYWGSNMIWGYHITAVSLSLAFGDNNTAKELLEGYGERMTNLNGHPFAPDNVEWYPDLAQLLVLGATYGLPLTNEEAHIVMDHYAQAAEHYGEFEYWDLWDASIPDGQYYYIPDRYTYDGGGQITSARVRITEIANLQEYCYSPLKDESGAPFVDCDTLIN